MEAATKINSKKSVQFSSPSKPEEEPEVTLNTESFSNLDKFKSADFADPLQEDEKWSKLMRLPDRGTLFLNEDLQKKLGLNVGLNVSEEFPWKWINVKRFYEVLNEEEMWNQIKDHLDSDLPNDILIGYATILANNENSELNQGDPFIFYGSDRSANEALQIIREIEAINNSFGRSTHKTSGGFWNSRGSEQEVNTFQPFKEECAIALEFQSFLETCRQKHKNKINVRTAENQYKFLLPIEEETKTSQATARQKYLRETINRRIIDSGAQSTTQMNVKSLQVGRFFPENAASQYSYDIDEENAGLDYSEEDEEALDARARKSFEKSPSKPIEISSNLNFLIESLDCNKIGVHNVDYNSLEQKKNIDKFSDLQLNELMSFAQLNKSLNRVVSSAAWYPFKSGLIALSYTYSTPSMVVSQDEANELHSVTVETCPVLVWSCEDPLNYKLELTSSREVTCLSFSPYNPDILIGGTINGQVVLWDLQGRMEDEKKHETLTPNQAYYRGIYKMFLKWIKPGKGNFTVNSVDSLLSTSHTKAITSIEWLDRSLFVSRGGVIRSDISAQSHIVVTTSFDGSVAFWNLDDSIDEKILHKTRYHKLDKSVIPVSKYSRKLSPIYQILHPDPLLASIFNCSFFQSELLPGKEKEESKLSVNIPIDVKEITHETICQQMIAGSVMGLVYISRWHGSTNQSDDIVKENVAITHEYSRIHDGPVIALDQNPFWESIFASIGGTVFCIWKKDHVTPIFWRKVSCNLTAVTWSHDRPALLMFCRFDGYAEVWDFCVQSNGPIFVIYLSGGIITVLTEHWPMHVLGISTYNSSFHIISVPSTFFKATSIEHKEFKTMIDKIYFIKQRVSEWEQQWRMTNQQIVNIKKVVVSKSEEDTEHFEEKENISKSKNNARQIDTYKKYVEHLEWEWNEKLFDLYLKVLTERYTKGQNFLPSAELEKDRIKYEEQKTESLKKVEASCPMEVEAIKELMVPGLTDIKHETMVENVSQKIIETAPTYENLENQFNEEVEVVFDSEMSYISLSKYRARSLNSMETINTERETYYLSLKKDRNFHNIDLRLQKSMLDVRRQSAYEAKSLGEVI